MKTLFLECGMGAAGDMLMAALLELIPDRQAFISRMNSLGLPGVEISLEASTKCGVTGSHVRVAVHGEEELSEDVHDHVHDHHEHDHHEHDHHEHDHHHEHEHHEHDHHHEHHHEHGHHHHHHASMAEITAIIESLPVSDRVKADACAVYRIIAEAESQVHGHPVSEIHFHEVGAMDAIADVVGVCMLMELLGAEEILASPVHVGSGAVRYGMGTKDFERMNCVRAYLGETQGRREEIVRLECNLDDMTGEELGFAMELLLESGARDVYTTPIGMKKSRPAVMLSVVCLPEDADRMAQLMLRHTTTLGVRRQDMSRYVLDRRIEPRETPWGTVRVKLAQGYGVQKSKPEYEDAARIARETGMSVHDLLNHVK